MNGKVVGTAAGEAVKAFCEVLEWPVGDLTDDQLQRIAAFLEWAAPNGVDGVEPVGFM